MAKTEDVELRRAFLKFCQTKIWANPQAVTLTFKQGRQVGLIWVRLTRDAAQQNLRHFRNVIHKQLGRHGFPKGAPLRCVPVFEGTDLVRTHVHLMLDRPNCIQSGEYADLIQRAWQRTFWGHRLTTVEPCHDHEGWLVYISKLRKKEEFADAVDWTNFS